MRLAWRRAAAIAGFLLVASTGAAKENGAQPGMAVPQKNEKPARWTAEESERVVCEAAVAGGEQLHAGDGFE